jgi:hypothetical protein
MTRRPDWGWLICSTTQPRGGAIDVGEDSDASLGHRWRRFLKFLGPGILVSIGFLDAGNLEADLQQVWDSNRATEDARRGRGSG